MPKFYFTYGTDRRFPFRGGWTEITAPDRTSACTIHKMFHPSAGAPNCSDIYTQEQFERAFPAPSENFGAVRHESIVLERDVFTPGGEEA